MRAETRRPRGARSLSTHLKSRLHLQGVKMGLLHELLVARAVERPRRAGRRHQGAAAAAAGRAARPVDEAISTAGGVRFEALDERLMASAGVPGLFVAGEMLDWEAPTGGYLADRLPGHTGRAAGQGVRDRLRWARMDAVN